MKVTICALDDNGKTRENPDIRVYLIPENQEEYESLKCLREVAEKQQTYCSYVSSASQYTGPEGHPAVDISLVRRR